MSRSPASASSSPADGNRDKGGWHKEEKKKKKKVDVKCFSTGEMNHGS